MHILYIVPYVPNPIRVRPYQLIRHLVEHGHQVTLATLWTSEQERAELQVLADLGVHILECPLPTWRSLGNCLQALPQQIPLQSVYCWQPSLDRLLKDYLTNGTQPHGPVDVIHIEHLRGAKYGLELNNVASQLDRADGTKIPIVWDSVDCISHLFQQAAQYSRSLTGRFMTRLDLKRTQRYEGWLVHQFDRILATSDTDCKALAQLSLQKSTNNIDLTKLNRKICVLPNGVDLPQIPPSDTNYTEKGTAKTITFIGKMSYHANITAVQYLVKDIMPFVWEKQPDVQIQIVGKDPPAEIQALGFYQKNNLSETGSAKTGSAKTGSAETSSVNGITPADAKVVVTGTVPHVEPYLLNATLAVAPILYGAGIQNKVLHAMACGTPVVASPQAASALKTESGKELFVADDAASFAQSILTLLDNPQTRTSMGKAGRAYVETNHAWDSVIEVLVDIYQAAIQEKNS